MKNFFRFLLIFSLTILPFLSASETFATLTVNGVNVITGQSIYPDSPNYRHSYYTKGANLVNGRMIKLSSNDPRVGRVKIQEKKEENSDSWHPIAFFIYETKHTQVYGASNQLTTYYYSPSQLIEKVEQYLIEEDQPILYRSERLFWDQAKPSSHLISRVLEDGQGQADTCYLFRYNAKGQLIQEIFLGNLSGTCPVPLLIQENGVPALNGIESYSTYYEYSPTEPDLVICQTEDNGAATFYVYDPTTKQCTGKLRAIGEQVVNRSFYLYDEEGLSHRMILDDGTAREASDLTGVANRQLTLTRLCQEGPAMGQPLETENRYLDLKTSQEILVEKEENFYSDEGWLIQKNLYNAQHELKQSFHFIYDEEGQLIETIDNRGEVTKKPQELATYRYNANGQPAAKIDEYGNEIEYTYDPLGRLIQTRYPAVLDREGHLFHPTIRQEYDVRDRVARLQDANGYITYFSYNSRGDPSTVLYPDGSEEQFEYFLEGTLKRRVARNGHQTLFTRDCFGRVLATKEFSSDNEELLSLFYTYQGNQLMAMTDQATFTTHFSYDETGRQTGFTYETPEGIHKKGEGDKNLKEDSKEDSSDASLSADSPFHTEETTIRNEQGQYVRGEEITYPDGTKERRTYDALQRLEKIQLFDPFGTLLKAQSLRYDGKGNKVWERHTVLLNGQEVRSYTNVWHYDAADRLVSLIEGLESPEQKKSDYTYNTRGDLERLIKPDGVFIDYSYTSFGKIARLTASDQSIDYRYVYDNKLRLIQVEDLIHSFCLKRCYNHLGALVKESFDERFTLNNCYDPEGKRTALVLPDGSSIAYTYDKERLRLVQRLDSQQQLLYTHQYTYKLYSSKLMAQQLIGDLGTLNYEYNREGRLIHMTSPWRSESVTINDSDHVSQRVVEDPLGKFTQTFAYGADHQITAEGGEFEERYLHDSLYNRVEYQGKPWIVNEHNQLLQTATAAYAYDFNGNCIKRQEGEETFSYEYDALNRLIRVTEEKKQAFDYLYDLFHRRLRQCFYEWNPQKEQWDLKETSYFLYDGDCEIGRMNEEGELLELRVLGSGKGAEIGAAVALELTGSTYVPIHDQRGSICCLVDLHKREVAECYRYSAYGVERIFSPDGCTLSRSAVGNPWRYVSKRRDDTGLIYFGKRYYNPMVGRWLTPDPLSFYDTANLYAFVRNDPLNYLDLYGLFSIKDACNFVFKSLFFIWNYCYYSSQSSLQVLKSELHLSDEISDAIDGIGRKILRPQWMILLGYHCDDVEVGFYGDHEISDKVRITFINGILSTRYYVFENYEMISRSHGGTKVHYVFCPTQGWTADVTKAALVKLGFTLGFRPLHAELLANLWKKMIREMGGVGQGGVVIHYAHSLGGSITDRARSLLTSEEQKMIHVMTFGSATLIRDEGFAKVTNYVAIYDGVSLLLEPLGLLRNYFDPDSNLVFRRGLKKKGWWPFFPFDHILTSETYRTVVEELGEEFLSRFAEDFLA